MYETLLTRTYKALVYDELDEYDEAIAFLTDELGKAPNNPIALNNRGIAYLESGRPNEALADLTAAVHFAAAGDDTPANNLAELKRRF